MKAETQPESTIFVLLFPGPSAGSEALWLGWHEPLPCLGFPKALGILSIPPPAPPSQLFKEVAEGVMVGGGRLPVRKQVGKAAQHRALLPPSPAQAQSPRLWSLVAGNGKLQP